MFKLTTFVAMGALFAVAGAYAQAASPDDTRIVGTGTTIIDAQGAKWTLSGGYVYVNGVRDLHSYQVTCLAYEGRKVWQRNATNFWWRKSKASDSWAPTNGSLNSPLPPITATVSNGNLTIRSNPQAIIGITLLMADGTSHGSETVVTDSIGNVSLSTKSLFGSGTYLISEFSKPILLNEYANILMVSAEDRQQDDQHSYSDITSTYNIDALPVEWSYLSNYFSGSPTLIKALAKSLGTDQAYINYNGHQKNSSGQYYVLTSHYTATSFSAIDNILYIGLGIPTHGKLAFSSAGVAAYANFTVDSLKITLP